MNATKHTPGPWMVNGEYTSAMDEIHDAFGRALAVVWTRRAFSGTARACFHDDPAGKANAALIAAAPDLLAALREIAEMAAAGVIQRNETGKPTWCLIDELKRVTRAAIDKAEGIGESVGSMKERGIPSPYSVICDHGTGTPERCFLTREQYDRQMNLPDTTWRCPVCRSECHWDAERCDTDENMAAIDKAEGGAE